VHDADINIISNTITNRRLLSAEFRILYRRDDFQTRRRSFRLQKPHGDPIAISKSIAQICVPGIAIDLVFNNTENTPQDQMSVVGRRATRDRFAEAPEFGNGIAIPPDLD